MMKRFMVLSLGFALCLGIIGCGGGGEAVVPESTDPPPEKTPSSESTEEAPLPGMIF